MNKEISEATQDKQDEPIKQRIGRAAYTLSLVVGRATDRKLVQISIAMSMLNIAMTLADTSETAAMRMYNQARRVVRKES